MSCYGILEDKNAERVQTMKHWLVKFQRKAKTLWGYLCGILEKKTVCIFWSAGPEKPAMIKKRLDQLKENLVLLRQLMMLSWGWETSAVKKRPVSLRWNLGVLPQEHTDAQIWMTWAFSELTVAAWTHGETQASGLVQFHCVAWLTLPVLPVRSAELLLWSQFTETVPVHSRSPEPALNPCLVTAGWGTAPVPSSSAQTFVRLSFICYPEPRPFISINPLLSLHVQYKTLILAIYPPKYCECTALKLQLPHGCTPAHPTLII